MDPAKKKRVLKMLAGREADRAQARELLVALGDDALWREALAGARTHTVVGIEQLRNDDLALVAAAPDHLPEVRELRSRNRKMYFSSAVGEEASCLTHLDEVHLTAAWGSDAPVFSPSLALLHHNPVTILDLIGVDLGDGSLVAPFPLRELRGGNTKWSALPVLPRLEVLTGHADATTLGAGLPALRRLELAAAELSDLTALAGATRLEELTLTRAAAVRDLDPVRRAVAAGAPLREVRLLGARRVESLAPFAGAPLEHLELEGVDLTDLSPLAGAARLRWLAVRDAPHLAELSPVAKLPALQCLDLRGCSAVRDLSPALALPALRVLALRGTGVAPADVPAALRPYCTWADTPVLERLADRPRHPDDTREAA
ncbi:MAG: hypothetical protein ABMA64_32505 [Myxococcota bacterium]